MRLDEYLIKRDVTPTAFAAEIGVAASTITRIIRGERSPRFDLVMKIKKATGGLVTDEDWYEQARRRTSEPAP